ncbi:MAG: formylglycine-generating enzyme family protein [Anaerolineales bacterium]
MDNSVPDNLSPEELERLSQLRQELEGQELTALLRKISEQLGLSINEIAKSAGMDMSALHKIMAGENREFKKEHVDLLVADLESKGKFDNPREKELWRQHLRIAAHLHFDLYKAAEIRLRNIADPEARLKALVAYLRSQYAALAETYETTGGEFPAVVTLADMLARNLLKRWDWIRVPEGYELQRVGVDRYDLISTTLFPKKLTGLDPNVEVKDTGFGTYTIRRKPPPKISPTSGAADREKGAETKPEPSERIKRFGGLEWVRIPVGKFLMGSKPDNKLAYDDEKPQLTVNISYDYWIALTPVTNAQYREFVEATKRDWKPSAPDDHPAVNVSWHDALAYCKWLTEKLQQKGEITANEAVRLPTEAEWEKAARGEYGNEWPWGNEWDASRCNNVESNIGGTTPVGKYSPAGDSPYGVADMAGNVWEWCRSLYKPYPYRSDDGREDLNAEGDRVLRGGSFIYYVRFARCAYRIRFYPLNRDRSYGFRVAVSPFQL